jgi:hypothetical protein
LRSTVKLSARRPALGDGHTAGLVFLGKFAAHADAEDESALGQMVEGRNLLGHRRGMAQRQEVNGRAELQAATDDRGLCKLEQRIEDGEREGDVVPDPKRIVAAAVDQLDQRAHLVDCRQPRAVGRFGAPMDGLHADAQTVVQGQAHPSIPPYRARLEQADSVSSAARTGEQGRCMG